MASRRELLGTGAAALLGGFNIAEWLGSRELRADTRVTPDIVQLHPSIEPVVQLIERTPRAQCFEVIAEQLRKGLPYRQFLAALFLAGIRNVNPQPPGFKFHCVFVIHACHQASLDAPVQDRLLPLFFALDTFKASQAKDVEQGDFRLKPITGRIKSPEASLADFHAAMHDWDEDRADRAIVGMIRGGLSSHHVIDQLWHYGARDYRNIGHKAIFVANTWRTLQTIGWQHAEPALRSLVRGLLDFGKHERVNDFSFEDQTWFTNAAFLKAANLAKVRWQSTQPDAKAALHVLETCRSAVPSQGCAEIWRDINSGKLAISDAWDGVHLAAGELMMRQPAIFGIHTVTSINGLRYAFDTANSGRAVILLQAIGWLAQFRQFMAKQRSGLRDIRIDHLKAGSATEVPDLATIFNKIGRESDSASQAAFEYAAATPQLAPFASTARSLIFRKGTDAHDYKFSTAMFEDYGKVSPAWRPHMLATSVYYMKGNQAKDAPTMTRARAAIQKLSDD